MYKKVYQAIYKNFDSAMKEHLSLVRQAADEAVAECSKEEEDCDLAVNDGEFCPRVLSDDLDWDIGGTIPQDEDIIASMLQHMMINKIVVTNWWG